MIITSESNMTRSSFESASEDKTESVRLQSNGGYDII